MKKKFRETIAYMKRKKLLYFLLIPGIAYFILFKYVTLYGVIIAFKDFKIAKGIMASPWNNFENFKVLFASKSFYRILFNSLTLSVLRVVVNFPIPIILALMINEIRCKAYKRITQTIIYLPHFVSWVIMGSIVGIFLSLDGFINQLIRLFGMEPIPFLAKTGWFRTIVVVTSIIKGAGWGTIIYLAAISGIDPVLYQAAIVDGANRIQQIIYVTLPSIRGTIIVLLILSIGRLITNGFEQIFVLDNEMTREVSEVFETFIYRIGLVKVQYGFATAVGLFQSIVGVILIVISNSLAKLFKQNALY